MGGSGVAGGERVVGCGCFAVGEVMWGGGVRWRWRVCVRGQVEAEDICVCVCGGWERGECVEGGSRRIFEGAIEGGDCSCVCADELFLRIEASCGKCNGKATREEKFLW